MGCFSRNFLFPLVLSMLALSAMAGEVQTLTSEQSQQLKQALEKETHFLDGPIWQSTYEDKAILHNISIEEAKRRVKISDKKLAVLGVIRDILKDRLVGVWVENTPDYQIFIRVKGDEPVPNELNAIMIDNWVPVNILTGSQYNQKELFNLRDKLEAELADKIPNLERIGADINTGEVVVEIHETTTDKNQPFRVKTQINTLLDKEYPIRIDSIKQKTVDSDEALICFEGGSNLL